MCGICGVIQVGGEPRSVVPPEVLDRMTDAMIHRGPNDRGTYTAPGVAIGARRLSIVDVDGGHQPFSNEDGRIWAAQNGELYNHDEHRRRLVGEGHRFRSRCDTEILPHLYERYGTDFPKQLRGKYAVVLWDANMRRGVLARDRLGVKPLYYAVVGDLVVFGSELKSVLASGLVDPALDYEAIEAFLTFGFFAAPHTPLAGVKKLMPGAALIVDPLGVRAEQYWAYPEPNPDPKLGADEAAEGLLEQLDESVRLRLMSDVPLGAMLSGGLDSSLIVALMARHMAEPVKTFSVGFVGGGEANELSDARLVSETLGTDHHELELSVDDATVDLEELVWHMDEPLASLSSLGFLHLSKLAAQHVTVALSGQGADELLGGYSKHRAATIAHAWNQIPRPARRLGELLISQGPDRMRRAARTLQAPDAVDRLLAMSGKLDDGLRLELARGPLAGLDGDAARRVVLSRTNGMRHADPLPATLYIDAQLALVDDMLHYFDRASMAHSLEVRVPFLDHHVVEYCARIPSELKVRRLTTKYVLKRAARGLIPDRIIDKRKMGFFHHSVDGWLRAQTDGLLGEYLLGESPRYAELLDRQTVRRLVETHADGSDTTNRYLLLSILMLEVWLATFLPRALGAALADRSRVVVPAA
jgi:asparagine synthase (glutamine-hydrolysing)